MKLVRPVRIQVAENTVGSSLNPFTESFLRASFDLLSGWLPYTAEEMLARYREKDPSFRFSLTVVDERIYVLFSLPWLDENGQLIKDASPACAPVSLLVGLVFNHDREVIADLALYHLAAADMHNEKIRAAFEEESDWLYWQAYIVDELFLLDHEPEKNEEVLVYTNAYTGRDERQNGIFRNLMNLSESFFAREKSEITLYSVISLDPDIACYGKDKGISHSKNDIKNPFQKEYRQYPYLYNVANSQARQFYADHGVNNVGDAYELGHWQGANHQKPLLMQCRHCIRRLLGACKRENGAKTEWKEPLFLRMDDGKRLRLQFDCQQCQMNVYAEN